jgi:hypothetical protein
MKNLNMQRGVAIRYQRVTLIDKNFGGPQQLRFCAVLLINGMPCRCIGHALSAPRKSWQTAIEEWFAQLDVLKAADAQVEDSFCAACTPDVCAPDRAALLDEQAALLVASQLVLQHKPLLATIDFAKHQRWVETLFDFVDANQQ